jgi:hypothetical protein
MHNLTLPQEMNDVMALAPKILQAKTVPADVFAVFLCGSLKLLFANYYIVAYNKYSVYTLSVNRENDSPAGGFNDDQRW